MKAKTSSYQNGINSSRSCYQVPHFSINLEAHGYVVMNKSTRTTGFILKFQARRKPAARPRSSRRAGEPSRLAKSWEKQAGSPIHRSPLEVQASRLEVQRKPARGSPRSSASWGAKPARHSPVAGLRTLTRRHQDAQLKAPRRSPHDPKRSPLGPRTLTTRLLDAHQTPGFSTMTPGRTRRP